MQESTRAQGRRSKEQQPGRVSDQDQRGPRERERGPASVWQIKGRNDRGLCPAALLPALCPLPSLPSPSSHLLLPPLPHRISHTAAALYTLLSFAYVTTTTVSTFLLLCIFHFSVHITHLSFRLLHLRNSRRKCSSRHLPTLLALIRDLIVAVASASAASETIANNHHHSSRYSTYLLDAFSHRR